MLPCFKGQIAGMCEERMARYAPAPSVLGRAEEVVHWSPSESSDPQERLMKPRRQVLSLFIALLGAVVSLWSLRDPDACVSFTEEQAYAPKRCKALKAYSDANTHLLGFCYMNCGDTAAWIYAWSMVMGLLLQSLTVLPSHCHCGQFLRVTWRVDFSGDLAELEELAKQRSGWWLWRRIQAWTGARGNLFDWLERLLQKQSKMLPLHMAVIHKASMFWLSLGLLELLMHTASSVRWYQGAVVFQCESIDDEILQVKTEVQHGVLQVSGQVLTLLLLSASLALSCRAQWWTCLDVEAGALREVLRSSGSSGSAMLCPKNKHPQLSRVRGKQLMELRSRNRGLPVQRPKLWGEDATMLQAYFGSYREPSQTHRHLYLFLLAGLSIVLLFGASSSCWGCIDDVSLDATGGLFDVEAQLLLLGSCGRHNGSGIPCLLSALCLAIVILAQMVIISAVTGESDEDEMALTLVDFREYQENLIDGLYAGQTVRSHVWLRPVDDSWEVANFLDDQDRSKWRRSQSVVSGVRIVQKFDDEQWELVHSRGLPTSEGPSTVYVQFEDPQQRSCRQMVPVDFLPGAFFCSVSVGRKQAWNNLSMLLACSALALVVLDLSFHLQYSMQGTVLKDCEDILSGRCLELEPGRGRAVRSAMGVYFAILGAVGIILVMVLLHSLR